MPEPEPEPEPDTTQPERRGPSGARIMARMGASQLSSEPLAAPGRTLSWAEQLDVHTAYQPALQPRPQDDVNFYVQAYQHLHAGAAPQSLREDFCGTMLVSLAWVKSAPDRQARCVDLDPEVIAWGKEHNIAKEPQPVRERLDVQLANVLDTPPPASADDRFDVICANNYSHQCLKDRDVMLCYLTKCRASLAEGGILVLDLCGGPECEMDSYEELARAEVQLPSGAGVARYQYVYEQCNWNPATREQQVKVSFKFDDGSWMRHAFVYDWRVWPVAEMREVMLEAGFKRTAVCIDSVDELGYSHNFEPLFTQEEFDKAIIGEEFYSCYIVCYTNDS